MRGGGASKRLTNQLPNCCAQRRRVSDDRAALAARRAVNVNDAVCVANTYLSCKNNELVALNLRLLELAGTIPTTIAELVGVAPRRAGPVLLSDRPVARAPCCQTNRGS